MLRAAEQRYASATTYEDSGSVNEVLETVDGQVTMVMPFATAFERGGRFLWTIRGSMVPGRSSDYTYTMWSKDQETYRTRWDLPAPWNARWPYGPPGQSGRFQSLELAMAAATGISGGSATVVVPLLRRDMEVAIRTTELKDPVVDGAEMIDGVACTRIRGKQSDEATVTVWLDDSGAIRRVYEAVETDPAGAPQLAGRRGIDGRFTSRTTTTIKPVFNAKIDDSKFAVPKDLH